MKIDKIYQGNAIDVMKTLPDKSVNCIITSPPYWGLRSYKTDGVIWDGDPNCPHDFISDGHYNDNMRFRAGHNTQVGNNKNPEIYTIKKSGGPNPKEPHARFESSSQFCSLCGAWKGELGSEPTFTLFIQHLVQVFTECKRILRDDGCLFVNLGDTYASGTRDNGNGYDETRWEKSKEGQNCKGWHIQPNRQLKNYQAKCLCLIPERFAIAMVDGGWILRNKIIWYKRSAMPSSAKDRFTVDWEAVYFFTKKAHYYFEQQFEPCAESTFERIKYPRGNENSKASKKIYGIQTMDYGDYSQGRNKRCVWDVTPKGFKGSHYAVFPEALVEPMIKAGCPEGGLVYDPFMGAGTTAVVAKKLNRHYLGSELNQSYIEMAEDRIKQPNKVKRIRQMYDSQPELELSLAGG